MLSEPEKIVLEDLPDYERLKDVTVWYVVSSWFHHGHWEYLLKDSVLEPNIPDYFLKVRSRGAIRISMERIGPLKDAFNRPMPSLRGASSLAVERRMSKLEEFEHVQS